MESPPPAEKNKLSDEIMFKDVSKGTLNGFLGIAIHWLAVPAIFLFSFVF